MIRKPVIPFLENPWGLLRRPRGIAGITGYPEVKPTWNSEKSLTIEVALHRRNDGFEWRKTEMLGVTIQWVVKEIDGPWDKNSATTETQSDSPTDLP